MPPFILLGDRIPNFIGKQYEKYIASSLINLELWSETW